MATLTTVKTINPATLGFHKDMYRKCTFFQLDQFSGVAGNKDESVLVRPKDIDKVSAVVSWESDRPYEETVDVHLPFAVEALVFKKYSDDNISSRSIHFIQNGVVYTVMDESYCVEDEDHYDDRVAMVEKWDQIRAEVANRYHDVDWR